MPPGVRRKLIKSAAIVSMDAGRRSLPKVEVLIEQDCIVE
jgi:hypothetical protein